MWRRFHESMQRQLSSRGQYKNRRVVEIAPQFGALRYSERTPMCWRRSLASYRRAGYRLFFQVQQLERVVLRFNAPYAEPIMVTKHFKNMMGRNKFECNPISDFSDNIGTNASVLRFHWMWHYYRLRTWGTVRQWWPHSCDDILLAFWNHESFYWTRWVWVVLSNAACNLEDRNSLLCADVNQNISIYRGPVTD